MTQSSTTNYAEITAGFIQRFGVVGPLLSFLAPALKLTVLIKLKNPDKNIFIDLGAKPMNIVVDGPQREADLTMTLNADMFHYMLWGKLAFPKAVNEKIALIEIKTGSMSNIPVFGSAKQKHKKPRGRNDLYEIYLINIGAAHLLDEPVNFTIPPPGDVEIRTIELHPHKVNHPLVKTFSGAAFCMGLVAGLILRLFLKNLKPKEFTIPRISYITYDEVFAMHPKPDPMRNRLGFALTKFFFSRVDLFKLIKSIMRGMNASGVFKQPLGIWAPLVRDHV